MTTATPRSRTAVAKPAPKSTPLSASTIDLGLRYPDASATRAQVDTPSPAVACATPRCVAPGATLPPAVTTSAPSVGSREDPYLALRAIAEVYEDLQRVRIGIGNRVARAPIDGDLIAGQMEGIAQSEHQIKLLLRRTFRKTVDPEIVAWQAETIGVGEHLLARLLGVIGHPVHTTVHRWEGEGSERTLVVVGMKRRRVSDLWSYCGHGDATRRRAKGMSAADAAAMGNPRAKMLTHLIAESCLKAKARSPYGPVYDAGREKYEEREDWTPAHRHNAALRLVGKEVLRDLWYAAGGAS